MRDLRVTFPKPCDEPWEAMAPAGCDRVCARCDKVIHDLEQYRFEEVEAMLRRDQDTCVRARIDADGVVALRPAGRGRVRRMVVAAGVSAGLLATSQPAFAGQKHGYGELSGTVAHNFARTVVTATRADGKRYRRTVTGGKYLFSALPAGTYTLTFTPDCGDSWTVENVAVGGPEPTVADTEASGGCIIVGQLRIEDHRG